MVTKSLVEVPFSVHGLIFIESVRGPLPRAYNFLGPPCPVQFSSTMVLCMQSLR